MLVRDIMTARPVALLPTDPTSRAARLMRDLDVGAMPVVEDLRDPTLLGLVTDRDLMIRCLSHGHGPSCQVQDHMTKHLVTVTPDSDADEAAEAMARANVGRVPVVDENGKLVGIVARADLAKLGASPASTSDHGFLHGAAR